MASISPSTNSSASSEATIPRSQAGPLPSKRGEIGFVEGMHVQDAERRTESPVNLPARHPADRDASDTSPIAVPPLAITTNNGSTPSSPVQPVSAASISSTSVTSTENSITKTKKSLLGFLKPDKVPAFGGLRLTTLVVFAIQVLCLGGTVTAWVLISQRLSRMANNEKQMPGGTSSSVFVHVVFLIAVLTQLLFLERRLFRLRAERYSYIHPGEMLPRYRNRSASTDTALAFSPWNRPPLPTYATALAQSGTGTGDVEDHLIAAPPPPAYGNTRGSTLLLTGFLRDSLRAQRPSSGHSQTSQQGRPLSYVSRDGQWEEIQDAERARRLEDTLSQLERPSTRM
ncbi:hypothetical protein BDQ12DRAFT_679967 [Crucibulum laeve]|uniref:Uncharacterized protein n=1 Tax=Crucibulum laeve TaxID=68775 RepID=A0A5C3M5P6_9AGAR|nr:hypothetical protein BDQ12DRAFT_679967 [Crucibulum laeve]